ncbi:MAG: BlaI/MecI/CopY family transcriptional regulator [Rhodothermaceae bacterium]|nr:BlaI/MecI/CopY family transcriptional regulator [Rhodothermaceae bacterium]
MSETPDLPKPSDGELEILHELWSRGPLTVREVHEALSKKQKMGYTTILKMMQIMYAKGLVIRDDSSRAHIYEAAIEEEVVQDKMVRKLLDRVFKGSAEQLILRALSVKRSTPEELDEIRKILDSLENDS